MENVRSRTVPNWSMRGPHKNFITQGLPKREVRPIASRLTHCQPLSPAEAKPEASTLLSGRTMDKTLFR